MTQYRKKPVVVNAIQYTGTPESIDLLKDFCVDADSVCHLGLTEETVYGDIEGSTEKQVLGYVQVPYIHTLEGQMLVREGDYVIQGVHGEFYPCKPEIFKATYEKV